MIEAFRRTWKEDFNFRITIVFWVLYCIDIIDGEFTDWIVVPYFTSLIYGFVKFFLNHRVHRKFMKEQEELHGRFDAAMERQDIEEVKKLLALLEENLIEYEKKMGLKPYEREEL